MEIVRPRSALGTWVLLGGILLGLGGFVVGPRTIAVFSESKHDVARLHAKQFANEMFPQWARSNPERTCPKSLSELTPYGDYKSIKDPWGRPYLFTCGGHRIYVASLGDDGKADTADDIWSHQ